MSPRSGTGRARQARSRLDAGSRVGEGPLRKHRVSKRGVREPGHGWAWQTKHGNKIAPCRHTPLRHG